MFRGNRHVRSILVLLILPIMLSRLLAACGGDDEKKSASSTPAEGTLTTESARVDYRPADSEEWQAITGVQTVGGEDAIRTDASGRALLNFYTGTEVEILPGSEVVVTQLEETAEGGHIVLLNQLSGETQHHVALVADTGSRYEINTPSANLVVRGTVFGVAVQPDGATTVQVREGVVQARAGEQTVEVSAGEALDILPDETIPGTPYPIPVIRPPATTPTPTPGVTGRK